MLTVAMAGFYFGGANRPDYPVATVRDLRHRFPAAHEEACSARYYEAARTGALDKLAPPAPKRTEPAPNAGINRAADIYARRASEREARTASSWDDVAVQVNRRLGVKAPEPVAERVSETAAWDQVIETVNRRYFNSVVSNRGQPSGGD
jgi:hypothetical protein